MLNDVAIAFLAAIFTLATWTIRGELQRAQRVKATKAAFAVEIATIATLVRENQFGAELRAHAARIRERGQTFGHEILPIHVGQSYFTVFGANASQLGELDTQLVVDVVAFYQETKRIMDACSREAQPDSGTTAAETAAEHYLHLADAIDRLCRFADKLVPKLATSQVTDQIALAAKQLRPEVTASVASRPSASADFGD